VDGVVVEVDVEAGGDVDAPVEAFVDGDALVGAAEVDAGAGSFFSVPAPPSEGGFSLSE